MRCPKCGYISFDHVDTCLKCNKDISKTASVVEGTTFNVAAPSFLRFPKGEKIEEEEDSGISFDGGDDFDVVDPDLDVLVDGDGENEDMADDATISFGEELDGFSDSDSGDDFEISLDDEEEDEDAGIDLGQFEDAFEEEQPPGGEEVTLDLPDELADISDLSAPAAEPEGFDEEPEPAPAAQQDDNADDFNLDLDLELEQLGDDFSLSSDKGGKAESSDELGLGDLSLDDIGLSPDEAPEKKKQVDPMDMDADLDFDLDLGGISLDDDK